VAAVTSTDPRETVQQAMSSQYGPKNVSVFPEALTPWIGPDAEPDTVAPVTVMDPKATVQQAMSSHAGPENVSVFPEALTPWIGPDAEPDTVAPVTVMDPKATVQQAMSSHAGPENVSVFPEATTPVRYPDTEPEKLTGSRVHAALARQAALHELIVSYAVPVKEQTTGTEASHWSSAATRLPPSGHAGSLVAEAQVWASMGQRVPVSPTHWAVSPGPVAVPSPSRSFPHQRVAL
jgi:uncharacterized Fe-S cluster protein YjdI